MEPTDTGVAMRRTALLIMLVCLALPAAALAAAAVPGDGTLSVRNGNGNVRLVLERGVAIGRIGEGQLMVVDPRNNDCDTLLVWDDGERAQPIERAVVLPTRFDVELRCIFKGTNMRFRLSASDGNNLRITGTEIGLSAVGRGSGRVKGQPLDGADGTYAVNGDDYVSLPDEWKVFQLAAPNSVG
jgi:hypothetical protein